MKDVRQFKFNLLLPEHFQDHIMGPLEHSWHKMLDAKFLNVVKEFERADKKKCANGEEKQKKSVLQKKSNKEPKGATAATMVTVLRSVRGDYIKKIARSKQQGDCTCC